MIIRVRERDKEFRRQERKARDIQSTEYLKSVSREKEPILARNRLTGEVYHYSPVI